MKRRSGGKVCESRRNPDNSLTLPIIFPQPKKCEMKRLVILLAALAPLTLTGCFEILEEIYLENGGKGRYVYTIDMSAIMDDSMQEMLQGEGESSLVGTEIDSVMYFKETHAEEIKGMSKPEIFKRGYMRLQISDDNDKMVMEFGLDFEDVNEIAYFLQNLNGFLGESMQGGEMGGGMILIPQTAEMFALKGKKLTRSGFAGLGGGMPEEEMGMMAMFMEGATFISQYHFPSKVKKTTIEGAVVEGKTVRVETSLLNLMSGAGVPLGWIKF
jgi:hypothetical protein